MREAELRLKLRPSHRQFQTNCHQILFGFSLLFQSAHDNYCDTLRASN